MGKAERTQISQYSPSTPLKVVYSIVVSILVGIQMLFLRGSINADIETPVSMIVMIIVFTAVPIWWLVIFLTQTKVTLYEEGIELQRGGTRLYAPWKSVRRLGMKQKWRHQVSGLQLRRDIKPETKGFIDGLVWGRQTDFLAIGGIVPIPLKIKRFQTKIDQVTLLRTDFGKALHSVKPSLFDELEQKSKNQPDDELPNDSQLERNQHE